MSDDLFQDESFVPRRGLSGGHLQTLAGNFLRRERSSLPPPQERWFEVEPGARLLCHCHWQPDPAASPAIIVVHGLEGSSDSQYVIGTGSKAWQRGFSVIRMNMRNCGGTDQHCPTLYHSGLSSDVAAVVKELIARDHLWAITAAGYSMGGNLVLKMAGEWGADAPPQLKAVAAVSPAMDLGPSADALHRPANWIYEWWFLQSLMRRYNRKVRLFPQRYPRNRQHIRSLRHFDDVITAPHCGFASADDYYYRAAAARVLHRIAVPALVLHALDDPFIRVLPQTRAALLANPHITYRESPHGGHCAFLADPNGYDGRWAERQVTRFFAAQV